MDLYKETQRQLSIDFLFQSHDELLLFACNLEGRTILRVCLHLKSVVWPNKFWVNWSMTSILLFHMLNK